MGATSQDVAERPPAEVFPFVAGQATFREIAQDAIFLRDLLGPITYWNPTPQAGHAEASNEADGLPGPADSLKVYLERRAHHQGLHFKFRSRLAAQPPRATQVAACRLAQMAISGAKGRDGTPPNISVSLAEAAGGIVLEIWLSGIRTPATGSPTEAIQRCAEAVGGWSRDAVSAGGAVTIVCWIPARREI